MSASRFLLCAILLTSFAIGCGEDDPTGPSSPTYSWREVDLGHQHAGSAILGVHIAGNHGIALGVHYDPSQADDLARTFYSLGADGTWAPRSLAGLPPELLALDAAVDADDGLMVVGYEDLGANAGRIFDARNPVPTFVGQDVW